MAKITITGVDAISRAFKELEPKLARKVVRQAERRALRVPYQAARSAWPVKSGKSKKSIRVRTSKGPRGARSHTIAMALLVGQAGKPGDKAAGLVRPWWAFLIERGFHVGGRRVRHAGKTVGYVPTHQGKAVRFIPGKHFMKRTLKSTEGTVRQIMTDQIVQGIESIARA